MTQEAELKTVGDLVGFSAVLDEGQPMVALTVDLVSAYIHNNHLQVADLPALIKSTFDTLASLGVPAPTPEPSPVSDVEKVSAAQVKKSVSPDFLVSFEDGKHYKTLRRHLTLRGLTPEQYRTKWGLPVDYPMVAQSYALQRSELARRMGLGRKKAAA